MQDCYLKLNGVAPLKTDPHLTSFTTLFFIKYSAQQSKARLGQVHLIFHHIQICKGELFQVTMYSAHKLKWVPLVDGLFLVYWTYKVG